MSMKIKLLIISCLFSVLAFGQMQDLARLAEGKIVNNFVLHDSNSNLYGYLYLYEKDNDEFSKTMEYVFLDKNLNKVSNAKFNCPVYKSVLSRYYDCTLMGDYVILNKYYYYRNGFTGMSKPLLTTIQTISLKENIISEESKYDNGQFSVFSAAFDSMKTVYKQLETKNLVTGFNFENHKGFIVEETNPKKEYLDNFFGVFNEKRGKMWNYSYNPEGKTDDYYSFRALQIKGNTLYVAQAHMVKKKCDEYRIISFDLLTGKKNFEYVLENSASKYNHTMRLNVADNQVILTGNYSNYKKSDFSIEDNLGFYKIVLDEKGAELEHVYRQWSDFTDKISIDAKGRVEKNFMLMPLRFYFFKDGSVSALTEKTKIGAYTYATTDLVLFNFNKSFALDTVYVIEKPKSYTGSDYLFSQNIKKDEGVVFFFSNIEKNSETNEKQTVLGINTIIGGKLTEEKIPLAVKKKYYIQPYPAKEGYIMLREYNVDAKYDQVRLERLNY